MSGVTHPDPQEFEHALASAVAIFEDGLDALVERIVRRLRQEVPGWDRLDSPEAWSVIADLTRAIRQLEADAVRSGAPLPERCPHAVRDSAVLAARAGVSLGQALKSRQLGHRMAWDAWVWALDQTSPSPGIRGRALEHITRCVLDYEARVNDLFTEQFALALSEARQHGHTRLRQVRELLAGEREELVGEAYPLEGEHLGVIAWGDRPEETIASLAQQLRGQALWVEVAGGEWWAWLARPTPDPGIGDSLRRFRPAAGSRVALGGPATGVQGFRNSHQQAGEARRVALCTDDPLTLFADVALEAMALRDRRLASAFVEQRLGSLASDRPRSAELRGTLARYFETSQNAASTAASLGVHEHTVARRLRSVEEEVGSRINDVRPELEVALRLFRLLEP